LRGDPAAATAAVAALEAEAMASMQGVRHGYGMMLVGDDFRFERAEA
jgi:hypothetical protein